MKRFLQKHKWMIAAAGALLFFAWAFGWGGGPINMLDFDADEVVYIALTCDHSWIAEGRAIVTQKEDIQTIIDSVNGFRKAGNEIGEFLRQGFSAGGTYLYNVHVYFKNGEEFTFVLCPMGGSNDTRFGYWGYQPERVGRRGQICRGSLDWFFIFHEKYMSALSP